ncbi:unnamed protein product [Gordionus sp. m RMFG-2023]|uniref:kappaPI-actitoxin-Avd3c-like n=1 Tax=Gordionus sp. m RMFG-2023 TaxID=3053472 RepID=UPI0030E04ED8
MKFVTYFIACLIILGGYNYFSVSSIACSSASPPVEDICLLPKDVGPCKAAFKRWYYNSMKRKCLEFIYGGCKGNSNNFTSLKICKKTCNRN